MSPAPFRPPQSTPPAQPASRAQWTEASVDRELARLNLGYTEIRAPIDGVAGNRSARAGAYATVGAQVLAIVPAHGL
jgi:membrane fusion protein, multidrug efflux system